MQALAIVALAALLIGNAVEKKRPPERKLYVGKDSVEATMSFDGEVYLDFESKPSKALAHEKIEDQLMHLFGPMGVARYYAVPKGDHEIILKDIDGNDGSYVVRYHYEGTIVVKVPGKGFNPIYKIALPLNPDDIYEAGIVETKGGKEKHPCTDADYYEEDDFWYFWNPNQEGCPLLEGTDYVWIEARLKESENTRLTFPDYVRLADDDGNIKLSVLMGMDHPEPGQRNPMKSKDENGKTYKTLATALEDRGYSRRKWSRREINRIAPGARPYPYVEEFEKAFERGKMVIRLFFGESGITENSRSFHHFYKDSLENDAVMIYDGHSGLGGHLDLDEIEKIERFQIRLPKDRYQIYFFNSCSSYSYYNSDYFARKATEDDPRGTKNLDILTNGLATFFTVMHNTNLDVIRAVEAWAANKASVSYQALAKKIDSGNLFGVNGDEDNPKKP